jgi:hypothetical protein
MDLHDLMGRHHRALLNRGHFAHRGHYQPEGSETSFPVTLTIGDVADQVTDLSSGRGQQWQISATGPLKELCNGILIALDDERQPILGDEWTVELGPYAGTWRVANVQPDEGDLVVLTLRFERPLVAAGAGTKGGGQG